MLKKLLGIALVGLFVLAVIEQDAFAEQTGGNPRPGIRRNRGQGECYGKFPEWKKKAIRRVREWAREKIAEIRADDSLTPKQKVARIRRVRRIAREKIRKILRARRRPRPRNGGGGNGAE